VEIGILRYSAASDTVRTAFELESMPNSIADREISVKNHLFVLASGGCRTGGAKGYDKIVSKRFEEVIGFSVILPIVP
jgi:hypothetical protein